MYGILHITLNTLHMYSLHHAEHGQEGLADDEGEQKVGRDSDGLPSGARL